MNFGESFWDTIWWFFWAFAFIAYLFVLFGIITDLFRDRSLNGWLKAVWLIFLLFLPFLTSLIYLIARGRGMAERSHAASQAMRMDTESYIRGVAGSSPSAEIAKAKELLDSGAINQQEFEHVKARALKLDQPSTSGGAPANPGAAPSNPGAAPANPGADW
ncbi:SHOCT domain-containing protein [Arthrobacter sp. CAU 1506]|uniref:SHOCT domain-containing protein n=1 Tax=Arthrobacter sp. CAU 1506 TaxID=2560052 RepID=UPI0010AD98E8|nr:SHOCT domain-containing protein [Arthrobacter sp. CAU 1506]